MGVLKYMKEFKDLKFREHPAGVGKQGLCFFDNGYGVSVVRFLTLLGGYGLYTANEKKWELAVLKGNEDKFSLCYDTHITNDVLGNLSESDINKIMKKVQLLPIKEA